MKSKGSKYEKLESFLSNMPSFAKDAKDTFLQISGYPNYENVISNLYAFFLHPEGPHGLKNLFMISLCECIPSKDISMIDYSVQREFFTQNGGKIDIIILENINNSIEVPKGVFIENKLYHILNNDLEDYYNSLGSTCDKTGIVLTILKDHSIPSKFFNVTHREWINSIKKNLNNFWDEADEKYKPLLKDFIEHIDTFYKTTPMELIDFLFSNGKKIEQVNEIENQGLGFLSDEIAKAIVDAPWRWGRNSNWTITIKRDNDRLVMYFNLMEIFSKHKFSCDLYLWNKRLVNKWHNTYYYKRTEELARKTKITLTDAENPDAYNIRTAQKEYSIKLEELYNFSAYINNILANEWEPLIKALSTNFKIN
jgi:hypothetical protein